ncbi:MAG: UDP-N-acetylmuramoyl-tripeptide--D-alanyl-D-alanine ligase [Candidatus Metalachnospira sp.]|nr:UDP-N-acetylmuramoyl-tripeptide--D-alanyl-D-alanine ligase [Candidatus Metalachnospira sp.]
MNSISSKQAAQFANGGLLGADNTIRHITTDSRAITEGCMFVALSGERFDGHSFIEQAWKKGASCVLSEQKHTPPEGKSIIIVKNTRKALLNLAAGYRRLFDISLVNVTGSVGKTTTKDMIADVLSRKYITLKTGGNFNNDIGVPITLFALDNSYETAVVEIGMNHFGEIDRLAEVCTPDIGVITNVGVSHIENLGSREGILQAKCEMLPHIKSGGYAVLNGNDDMLANIRGNEGKYGLPSDVNVIWYGIGQNNDVYADNIAGLGINGTDCTIHTPIGAFDVHITVAGEHMVLNALAATAVGYIRGLDINMIKDGIENFIPTGKRMEIIELNNGAKIIDDSYNANPVSMKAAIDVLASCDGLKIAVLGDMGELGDYAAQMHSDIGRYLAEKKIDGVITVGVLSENISREAKAGGVPYVRCFERVNDLLNMEFVPKGTILVKASHAMDFSKIVDSMKRCSP